MDVSYVTACLKASYVLCTKKWKYDNRVSANTESDLLNFH